MWVSALKVYKERNNGLFIVPSKGTPQYEEVKKIMAEMKEQQVKAPKSSPTPDIIVENTPDIIVGNTPVEKPKKKYVRKIKPANIEKLNASSKE